MISLLPQILLHHAISNLYPLLKDTLKKMALGSVAQWLSASL